MALGFLFTIKLASIVAAMQKQRINKSGMNGNRELVVTEDRLELQVVESKTVLKYMFHDIKNNFMEGNKECFYKDIISKINHKEKL